MSETFQTDASASARGARIVAAFFAPFALFAALTRAAPAQTTASGAAAGAAPPAAAAKPTPSPTPGAPEPRPQSTRAKAPRQLRLGKVNVNGSLRLRAEGYGWFETPGHDDAYTFGAAQFRLSFGQQRERWDWLVEGEFPVLLNLPGNAGAPAPRGQLGLGASYFAANGAQDASVVLKQAFVRAKGVFGDSRSSLRVGRFEFVEGAETTPKDATLAALKRERIAHRLVGAFGLHARWPQLRRRAVRARQQGFQLHLRRRPRRRGRLPAPRAQGAGR